MKETAGIAGIAKIGGLRFVICDLIILRASASPW